MGVRMNYKPLIEGDLEQEGQWRGGTRDESDGQGPKRTANVSCPGCGRVASLSGHTIREDGTVAPSVVYPFDCGFHDYIVLVGWSPEVKS